MKKMDTAPKGKVILLLLPCFDVFSSSWWPGYWSHIEKKWVVRTPYSLSDKQVYVADVPGPMAWEDLPEIP